MSLEIWDLGTHSWPLLRISDARPDPAVTARNPSNRPLLICGMIAAISPNTVDNSVASCALGAGICLSVTQEPGVISVENKGDYRRPGCPKALCRGSIGNWNSRKEGPSGFTLCVDLRGIEVRGACSQVVHGGGCRKGRV